MFFFNSVLVFFVISIIVILIRSFMGPTIWDRLLGFNMLSMKIVMSIILLAYILDNSFYLDIALVYVILGFVGTNLIARYIEKESDK